MPGFLKPPHVFAVSFENVTIGAAAMDLFTLVPGAALNLCLLGIEVDNVAGIAAAGDALEQFGRLAILRGYTAAGSGGSAATPRKTLPSIPDASFTARVNDTTLASTGSPETCQAMGLPSRAGVLHRPARLMRWHTVPGSLLVVRLMAAITTPFAASLTAFVAEYEPGKHGQADW